MRTRPHSHFHLPWRMHFRPNNSQQSKCHGCWEPYSGGDAKEAAGDAPRFPPPTRHRDGSSMGGSMSGREGWEQAAKQSILTQRDQLQRRVGAWGLGNSQALFIACSNDVYLFQWETDFRIRTMPWSIFNRVHIKHMVSGALKGL